MRRASISKADLAAARLLDHVLTSEREVEASNRPTDRMNIHVGHLETSRGRLPFIALESPVAPVRPTAAREHHTFARYAGEVPLSVDQQAWARAFQEGDPKTTNVSVVCTDRAFVRCVVHGSFCELSIGTLGQPGWTTTTGPNLPSGFHAQLREMIEAAGHVLVTFADDVLISPVFFVSRVEFTESEDGSERLSPAGAAGTVAARPSEDVRRDEQSVSGGTPPEVRVAPDGDVERGPVRSDHAGSGRFFARSGGASGKTRKIKPERTSPKQVARHLARILRKEGPDYHYVKKIFAHIRQELGLDGRPPAPKKLPALLTEAEVTRFYEAVWDAADRTHTVMIKLLLFTGIRNAELAAITLEDVDKKECTLRIGQGKGAKDRQVPFPRSFRGELGQYMRQQREGRARYLFETNRQDKFTTRWIRAIVKRYAQKAGIRKPIYPHLFRHQLLTHLAKKGIVDAKLQVLSGHASRKSLEIYQDLSLVDVAEEYQDAMKTFPVH